MYLFAQHQDVFPGLSGEQLLDSLRAEYTSTTLGYSGARDTLFRNVLSINNELACLYTGYSITLHPDQDPTKDAFNQNVNTEHIYPQSKGAKDEPAVSNMYILYPELVNVNSARGITPFGEVNDSDTEVWYYKNEKRHSIPPLDSIDLYTEQGKVRYEPREEVKGDVARSVFYFYTIYKSECLRLDSTFFPQMAHDLCLWHYADPVSSFEWNKNVLISLYQGGKSNPFILDCTLPERSYCADIGHKCIPNNNKQTRQLSSINIFPNPVNDRVIISTNENIDKLSIFNSLGRKVYNTEMNETNSELQIEIKGWMKGSYFVCGQKAGYITSVGRFVVN